MNIGEYNRKFIWLSGTFSPGANTNSQIPYYTSVGELWGSLEPVGANERLAFGMKGSFVDARIRIRNTPALKFNDRLKDKATDDIYLIDGVMEDNANNQLIVTAHRFNDRT